MKSVFKILSRLAFWVFVKMYNKNAIFKTQKAKSTKQK